MDVSLDKLAQDLAQREGDLPDNEDYELPTLEALSHNHPLLSATTPTFDVEAFLLSRSHTSLTDLRVELRDYLAQLKDELVQLINDDYQDFISLSTDLRGEGARLERIHAPVGDIRTQIQESSKELLAVEKAVQSKLSERTRLREEKALLRLLFNLSDSLTRLESLLLIPSPEEAQKNDTGRRPSLSDGGDFDRSSRAGRAKHLSRVAAEFVQLVYQAEKATAEKCAFVDENQWRIDRIKETLLRDIDQLFGNSLQSLVNSSENSVQDRARLVSDLSECFKMYDLLDMRQEAEEIIRVKIVQPFTRKSIYTGALNAPQSPVIPKTPFLDISAARMAPTTPFTPFTAYPDQRKGKGQPYFYFAEDNARLPFLEDVDNSLAALYNHILRFVERDCSEVMEIATRVTQRRAKPIHAINAVSTPPRGSPVPGMAEVSGHSNSFEIMANAVWAEIGRSLMDELGAVIFAAGKPAEFKKHYATTKSFLSALEYLAPDLQAVQSMRAHPTFIAFERRWQLPVYFQLRWKEIVGDLETSLSQTKNRVSLENDLSSGSEQAMAVLTAISRCWSPEVFIPELGHRFWKLTLQIIGRYKNWMGENRPAPEASAQVAAAIREETATITRSGTPPPQALSTPEPSDVHDDEKLRQVAVMLADVKVVSKHVLILWHEEISACADASENESYEDILQESLADLEALVPQFTLQTVAILTRKCCEPVAQVRQLPGQIKALSRRRDPPSAASPFVSEIFKPLRHFFGIRSSNSVVIGGPGAPIGPAYTGVGKALQDECASQWATEILEVVSTRYAGHLEYMKRNEEALRRLKRGVTRGFPLFGTGAQDDTKDEERVRAQMILDVTQLGSDAEAFGVVVDDVSAYRSLVSLASQNDSG